MALVALFPVGGGAAVAGPCANGGDHCAGVPTSSLAPQPGVAAVFYCTRCLGCTAAPAPPASVGASAAEPQGSRCVWVVRNAKEGVRASLIDELRKVAAGGAGAWREGHDVHVDAVFHTRAQAAQFSVVAQDQLRGRGGACLLEFVSAVPCAPPNLADVVAPYESHPDSPSHFKRFEHPDSTSSPSKRSRLDTGFNPPLKSTPTPPGPPQLSFDVPLVSCESCHLVPESDKEYVLNAVVLLPEHGGGTKARPLRKDDPLNGVLMSANIHNFFDGRTGVPGSGPLFFWEWDLCGTVVNLRCQPGPSCSNEHLAILQRELAPPKMLQHLTRNDALTRCAYLELRKDWCLSKWGATYRLAQNLDGVLVQLKDD